MLAARLPGNEGARLEALRRYKVLDTRPEHAFDDFASLASLICETPIALVSLVDSNRQWFKARVGLDALETPRDQAFCSHTILKDAIMVIEDAASDVRFSDNPLVIGDPRIRFYAGAPLITPDGYPLGSICAIDRQPKRITRKQQDAMETLARRVTAHLEMRLLADELACALHQISILKEMIPICMYCKNIRHDDGFWSQLEAFLHNHADMQFSHGICPDCEAKGRTGCLDESEVEAPELAVEPKLPGV